MTFIPFLPVVVPVHSNKLMPLMKTIKQREHWIKKKKKEGVANEYVLRYKLKYLIYNYEH